MNQTKRRSKSYLFVISLIVILAIGVTFAWVGFRAEKESSLDMLRVQLNVTFNMENTLTDVAKGDTVVTSIKFTPNSTDSCYVRASLTYSTPSTPTENEKKYLLAVNYAEIPTVANGSNKWVRHTDGYYYLTNSSGTPVVYTNSSGEYTFCNTVAYPGADSLLGYIATPANMKLKAEVQAVQSKNIGSPTVATLSTVFSDTFGASQKLGYIVTFDSKGGTAVMAQTFFAENQTVTQPTAPVLFGKTFGGWYTDSNLTSSYNFSTKVTKNMTLYAKWS